MVYFYANDTAEDVVNCTKSKWTHLTEWFVANNQYEETCRTLYSDFLLIVNGKRIPALGSLEKSSWEQSAGCVLYIHLQANTSFLQLLLTVLKGAKDWDDLLTVNGHIHESYWAAWLA